MAQHVLPANKGTIRHSIAVADITEDMKPCANATIGGVDWSMNTWRHHPKDVEMLGVYVCCETLETCADADAQIRATYVIRVLGVDPIEKSFTHTFSPDISNLSEELTAVWSEVKDPAFGFCVDGRITLEIEITVEEVKFVAPEMDAMCALVINLDDATFADMRVKVKGEDWEGIRCHKAVMCHNSKAIYGAMSNASMKEAKSGDFEIGEPCATKDGIEQFVRLNYEEWKEATMDKHAVELYVLGDVLICRRVKVFATMAMKRLLSVATFWPTLKAAVFIRDNYIVCLCARFANETPRRLRDLCNTEDGKEIVNEKDEEGAAALLVLMKAASEMK